MKKLLLILFILMLAAASIVSFLLWTGKPFGINVEKPLGTLSQVEKQLIRLQLHKDPSMMNGLRKMFNSSQVIYYTDPPQEGESGDYGKITVVATQDGKITQIIDEIPNKAKGNAVVSAVVPSKVKAFCHLYWNGVFGSLRLSERKDEKIAEIQHQAASGSWLSMVSGIRVEINGL